MRGREEGGGAGREGGGKGSFGGCRPPVQASQERRYALGGGCLCLWAGRCPCLLTWWVVEVAEWVAQGASGSGTTWVGHVATGQHPPTWSTARGSIGTKSCCTSLASWASRSSRAGSDSRASGTRAARSRPRICGVRRQYVQQAVQQAGSGRGTSRYWFKEAGGEKTVTHENGAVSLGPVCRCALAVGWPGTVSHQAAHRPTGGPSGPALPLPPHPTR